VQQVSHPDRSARADYDADDSAQNAEHHRLDQELRENVEPRRAERLADADFARALVGILGNAAAVGEAFHITSDEVLTWNQITETIAAAAGLEPDIVHIASDFVAASAPELAEGLLGDKAYSLVFDTSKLKRFVPGFQAAVPLAEGLARSLAWFEADPARKVVDEERDALLDRIVAAYAA